jgi:hypothetical protein
MVELVSAKHKNITIRMVGLILAVFSLPASYAQSLSDPTRPYGPMVRAEGTTTGPVLQSILIRPNSKTAIISGQTVPLGGTFGNARISRITDTEVTLVQGKEVRVLKLFSDLEKRTHIFATIQQTSLVMDRAK